MPHMEQIAAKVVGKVKAAKGTLGGLHGVFTTLMDEHGQVSTLMMRVKTSDDVSTRRELWPKIRVELLAHERSEIAVLYPAYRAHPELAAMADEHDQDADELEEQIAEVNALDVGDPRWNERFDGLIELVQRHVTDEEHGYFREGNRIFGKQAEALDQEYKQHKERLLQQLR